MMWITISDSVLCGCFALRKCFLADANVQFRPNRRPTIWHNHNGLSKAWHKAVNARLHIGRFRQGTLAMIVGLQRQTQWYTVSMICGFFHYPPLPLPYNRSINHVLKPHIHPRVHENLKSVLVIEPIQFYRVQLRFHRVLVLRATRAVVEGDAWHR